METVEDLSLMSNCADTPSKGNKGCLLHEVLDFLPKGQSWLKERNVYFCHLISEGRGY